MGNRAGEVVFDEFDVEADTSVEASDRRMQRRFKPLAPSFLLSHELLGNVGLTDSKASSLKGEQVESWLVEKVVACKGKHLTL